MRLFGSVLEQKYFKTTTTLWHSHKHYPCQYSWLSSVRILKANICTSNFHPSIYPTAQLLHYWRTPRYTAVHRKSNYPWSYWCCSSNDHTEDDGEDLPAHMESVQSCRALTFTSSASAERKVAHVPIRLQTLFMHWHASESAPYSMYCMYMFPCLNLLYTWLYLG